jgi:hypothetical protein
MDQPAHASRAASELAPSSASRVSLGGPDLAGSLHAVARGLASSDSAKTRSQRLVLDILLHVRQAPPAWRHGHM